jgi:hypothetical protein
MYFDALTLYDRFFNYVVRPRSSFKLEALSHQKDRQLKDDEWAKEKHVLLIEYPCTNRAQIIKDVMPLMQYSIVE